MAEIYEGIFWKINGELVTFADMIQPNNACATRLNHIKTWVEIKHRYLVNDEEVAYNYFPRGRITAKIAPTLTNDIALDVYIYLCKCFTVADIETLKDIYFLPDYICNIKYIGYEKEQEKFECHYCKGDEG